MAAGWQLVGRQHERAALTGAIAELSQGTGGLVLVAGEAGAGKTTLVEAVLSDIDQRILRGGAHPGGSVPYGPLIAALRDHLRQAAAEASWELTRLAPSLALVMPELAPAPPTATPEAIPPAIRGALEQLAAQQPTIVLLDDLQWADAATLTMLTDWVGPLPGLPLLLIGAYRTDELPRQHPVRSLRMALRRAAGGAARHVPLGPLTADDSATLVTRVLGEAAAPEVVASVCRRGHGLPFYLEELARTIAEVGTAAEVTSAAEVVPESVRDAVLMRLDRLSDPARAVAELVAAAGPALRLDVLAELAADDQTAWEPVEVGLLVERAAEDGSGEVAFRHALVAEALYAVTPWTRRRRHHAALAEALARRGASPVIVAAHWSKAHQPARARPLLVAAAEAACAVHAYRDAKDAIAAALAQWPPHEDPVTRLRLLDQLGDCAERCGETAEAARAWEEVAAAHRTVADDAALAHVQRRLAGVYELANDWPRALAARRMAMEAFARARQPAEAATEQLAVAVHLWDTADVTGALQLVRQASTRLEADAPTAAPAATAETVRIRAMALQGALRATLGEGTAGVELTSRALDLALAAELEALTAEIYYLHSIALEQATDYPAALDAMSDAVTICRNRGLDADAHICLACLTPALRHTGQWDRALDVGREVLAQPDAPEVARMVADAEVGLVLANRGKTATARRHLAPSAAFSHVHELFPLEVEASWGLARVDDLDGEVDQAAQRLRQLSDRCLAREERHYSVAALRWATSFFGRHGLMGDLGACTDVLARTAAATGTAEATAAVAHALGEHALAEGDARRAADQLERALELLRGLTVPAECAETQLRAGVALAAAGDTDKAIERLVGAYHTARALGGRPVTTAATRELEALGVDVTRRLGRRAAQQDRAAGLTRRELEVLRLVADGRTNREIARELFLSTRTVDMHVRNLLAKLGCHTRTEAVRRAGELALLQPAAP